MSGIDQLGAAYGNVATRSAARFFLPGAENFADKLTLGQIIKGRVLRQYEGSNNRYLVSFEGQERIVDSAAPLRTGELIQGRVVGLGDRVELQRVYADDALPAPAANAAVLGDVPAIPERGLDAMLAQLRIDMSAADRSTLMRAVRGAGDGEAMSLAGALLNRLGLPQSLPLLAAVYGKLVRDESAPAAAIALTPPGRTQDDGARVMQLAAALQAALQPNDTPPDGSRAPATEDKAGVSAQNLGPAAVTTGQERREERRGFDGREAGRWLLNAQSGSSVGHRHERIALLLGKQLVEVDLAMFAQQRDGDQKPAAQHKHLVFSLSTEALGRVEISARVVGGRLRVQVAAERSDRAAALAEGVSELRSTLDALGWQVDELRIETRSTAANAPARAVVEHVVRQGSLYRLV